MHRSSLSEKYMPIGLKCVLVCWLALLGAVGPVKGQGTMGTVPDPISSRDLSNYADRLALSDQQRQGIEALHEAYREEFRILRETDIEKYLQNSRGWQGGFGASMNRKEIEDGIRDLESILGKIKSIDNRFLDQVQLLVSEEQVLSMQAVRQARERARYRTGMSRMTGFMNPATRIDLGEMLSDMQLGSDEHTNVVAILGSYESTLTAAARKLHDDAINMMRDTISKLAAQGFDDQTLSDPQRRGQVWDALRPILAENNLKLMEQASNVSELNRKTLRSVTGLLNAEHARELRDKYLQSGYPELAGRGGNTRRAFDVASKFDELSDDQRQAILAMAAEFNAMSDRLDEQAMDLIDVNRKTQSFFDFDAERRRKQDEELQQLREKRQQASESALANLHATIGPELKEQLDKRVAQDATEGNQAGATVTLAFTGAGGPGMAIAMTGTSTVELSTKGDPFLPAPISRRDIDNYSASLKLTEETQAVLSSLHDDYLEQFNPIEESQFKKVRELQQGLWSRGPEGLAPPSVEQIDALYGARRAAISSVMTLDGSFFEDVQLTIGDETKSAAVQRARQSRQRDIYAQIVLAAENSRPGGGGSGGRTGGGGGGRRNIQGRGMRMFRGGSSETTVDLAAILNTGELTPSDPSAFDSAVGEYETLATALFQKLQEGALRTQQAFDKFSAQMAQNDNNGERGRFDGGGRDGGGMRALLEADGRASSDARREVASLNRKTLESLMALLPLQQAQDLKRAYQRKAYPDIFSDERSAEPHLSAADQLPDLNAQQRTALQEISLEFRGVYDELCQKMVDLESAAPNPEAQRENPDFRNMQEQWRNREKLQFERNDLNDKAIAKLRSVLTAEQVQRLGGLEFQD